MRKEKMTIEEFMSNNNIKKRQTVIGWIEKGYIPRAEIDKNFIPDSARVPYTKARARTAKGIYNSIVQATNKREHVMAKLYNLSEDEFNGYIERLIAADLIVKRVNDGITYYDATLQGASYNENQILNAVGKFVIKTVSAATYEMAKAITENKIGA